MAKRKVNWSKNALLDLIEIIEFYNNRNKSTIYSAKLNKGIKLKLQKLDFSIALPQKTTAENLYYFTHNHIVVCFEILNNEIRVQLLIDERRSPQLIQQILTTID